jgi:hypothetical protein
MSDFDFERRNLAYQWGASFPNYVYQNKNGEWRWYESDIAVLSEIVNPVKYYETVNTDAKVPLSLTLEDICFPYVAGNAMFKKYSLLDFQLMSGLDEKDETFITIQDINIKLEQKIPEMLERKTKFRAEFERELSYRERFDKLQPIPFEELSVDVIVKVYQINFEFILGTVYTLFDKIKVSRDIPLIITEKFYKVLKGHEYDLEIPDESNLMFLFTFRGKVEIVQKEDFFELSYEYKKGEDDTDYLNLICKTIGVSKNNLILGSERYNGISFFPNQTLSTVIWRDFIMNEPIASRNFFMDEHQLGIRNREGRLNIRKGFYVFYTEKDNRTTFTLKEDELTQGVRIRILNASSFEDAYIVLRKIAKLFSLYNEVGSQIASQYNTILKENLIEFNKPEYKKIQDKKSRLKDVAKDMFLPNYTRSCGFQPEIIPDSEVEKYSEKNQVMRFPKEGDEIEGKAFYFGCAHHNNHIFPGLRKNPMVENKNEYPILPCCYTVDQRNRRKCLFNEYYDSDKKLIDFVPKEKEQVKNIQYRFLISDKFVGFEQTGKCPSDIENLFMLYSNAKPIRKGVHRSRQSALECVLLTTKYKNYHELDSASRLSILDEELERLKEMDLTICAQECWDIEDPKSYLDTNRYLDPRYFIRLFETVYNCRIVLFSREDFIHPEHIEGYLRWNTVSKTPIVMLYEHMGSEANKANYPQCELILLENEDPSVSEWIYKDYLSSLDTVQTQPLPSEKYFTDGFLPDKIVGQHIDFYGKMYALNIQDKNNKITTFYFDKQRFPILTGVPKTTIGYYSEQGQKMFMRNGYSIRVFPKSEPSLLEQYNQTRRQMELLVENAKRIYANRIAEDSGQDWNWIEVNPKIKLDYSKYLFSSSERIIVPNSETKRRLQYLLRVYGIRYRMELMNYLNMKNIIPFKYRTIHDFEEQENAVIVDISVQINWFSNFYQAKRLDGTLYQEPFVAVIQNKSYKCNPIENLEGDSYWVMVPQFKKIFKVGNNPNRRFMVLKSPDQTIQYYNCQSIDT